jgi:hypothetical protein
MRVASTITDRIHLKNPLLPPQNDIGNASYARVSPPLFIRGRLKRVYDSQMTYAS